MEKITIVWDSFAEEKLMELYNFIAEQSINQADNVIYSIFEKTESLIENPENIH